MATETLPQVKTCTKCGEEKLVSEFDRRGGSRGEQRRSDCKSCRAARTRTHYANNRDSVLARMRRYKTEKPELFKAWKRISCQRHSKEIVARVKRWKNAHQEHVREWTNARRRELRWEVLTRYSDTLFPRCACCGEMTYEFLAIDHINNDGAAHRKSLSKTGRGLGSGLYPWLKQHGFPAGFQVLCHNCNMAKGFYGLCPHQAVKSLRPVGSA